MALAFHLTEYDRRFYEEKLADFLPSEIVDCHSHVWTADHLLSEGSFEPSRSAVWASRVAEVSPVEDLLQSYRELFPNQSVTPVIFPGVETNMDSEKNNDYVRAVAASHGLPSLALTKPQASADEFEALISEGGFAGCKPYLNFAPAYIPRDEIRIYDFLPKSHLERLNANRWVAMLHIARPGRLGDPMNLAHLVEIDENYPDAKVIVTHIGRAYAHADVGAGMSVLSKTRNLLFDITANTNADVMRRLIEAVGPERIMFGSDLPIFAMRAHRVVENDQYVNIVPRGKYGDVSGETTMRETDTIDKLTLLIYEEIAAFAEAAALSGLSRAEVEAVFNGNARRTFSI